MNITIHKQYLYFIVFVCCNSLVININAQNKHLTSACTPDSMVYKYTGSAQSFTVPSCVTSIVVRAWGAGGGGGGTDTHQGGSGGGGAYASDTLKVTQGQVFTIIVGQGGAPGLNHVGDTGGGTGGFGAGNGGKGGNAGAAGTSGAGGGGGGATALLSNGTFVMVAAGGGGGAGGGNKSAGGGGGAGGLSGSASTTSADGGIVGISPDSVGLAGFTPSKVSGATDAGGGGGGGGGYNGGGGGKADSSTDKGGGGGGGGNSLGAIIINGKGRSVGDSTYSGLAGLGEGGIASDTGGNGYMVISYCIPQAITVSTSTHNESCSDSNNAYAVATVTSGTGPFTYSWNTAPVQTSDSVAHLGIGNYTVTVDNGNGCPATATVAVTAPTAITITTDSVNENGSCNGLAAVTVSGGTMPYTYSWNTAPVQTTDTIKSLCAGKYCCYITDGNNCPANSCVTVNLFTGINSLANSVSSIIAYPNPGSGCFTLTGLTQGQLVDIYDYTGQKLSSTLVDKPTMNFDISSKPDGVYMISIQRKDGSKINKSFVLKH
ncbi:MAG TPA: T9SS type A sorting domain-containing protein [Bacteroidia bacterium]|jgi:hypothetical protein|nr:T9SS type A sorting domain-containing protein [Bacteroidia bacterium]